MTETTLARAQQGHSDAIATLINRSLQKQAIQATINLQDGALEVMLDASQVPNQAVAEFIHRGLSKLNIESAYEANVYGRKAGEHFASWSRSFELKPRPLKARRTVPPEDLHTEDWRLILANASGEVLNLDFVRVLGFCGSLLLLLGVFTPILNLPVVGTVSYFRNGSEEGIILIGLAIASGICLFKRRYSWVYGTGLFAFLLIALTLVHYQVRIAEVKSDMDQELSGNPFRGLADLAMSSVQLQWGWLILFLGAALILTAAYLKKRKLDRQAFRAMGVALATTVILALIQPTIATVENQGAEIKAQQSEARTYMGIINRAQQLHYLEKNQFSETLGALELRLRSETDNYQYQILMAEEDMAIVTATAQRRGLKSYTGATFLTYAADGDTTMTIVCESDRATRTAPRAPILNRGGNLQCLPGASKVN